MSKQTCYLCIGLSASGKSSIAETLAKFHNADLVSSDAIRSELSFVEDQSRNEEVFNNLLSFDEEDSSNMIDTYNDVKDRLVEKVIPFAEDPFGNLICFDYRTNKQPTIVFWEHEKAFNDKESAIRYLCDYFTELLLMLHELQE